MRLRESFILLCLLGAATSMLGADQPSVRVETPDLQGPRKLQDQTAKAAVQNYLDSWQSMSRALSQNRPDLLDRGFIGSAKEKLAATIKDQNAQGIHTLYRDRSHDVKILFYSPDGLSIELADTVAYDVQLFQGNASIGTQEVHARYLVVLTPTEVRWRVRIFESQPM
jgi:hypothetical protein